MAASGLVEGRALGPGVVGVVVGVGDAGGVGVAGGAANQE